MGAAGVRHLPKEAVQLIALGSGVLGMQEFVPDPVAVGADEAHLGVLFPLQQVLEQVGGAGLAAGAGDAHHLHLPCRVSEKVPAAESKAQTAVVRLHIRGVVCRRSLAENDRRTVCHSLGYEAMAVDLKAADRHKKVPGPGAAGIVADAGDFRLGVRGHGQHPDILYDLSQFHMFFLNNVPKSNRLH